MRRIGIVLVVWGVIFAAAAAAWGGVAVPRLVKFPLGTDVKVVYRGHLVTFLDSSTGAALTTPASVPLTIDRTMRAIASESSSGVAIVKEQIVLHYSGETVTETNLYALNRRSMRNEPSSHAWTFAPGNPAPAPGSYYVTLPMNVTSATRGLRAWKPETDTTYPLLPLRPGADPAALDGMQVVWFSGVLPPTPVASYERTALAAEGLPMTMAPSAVEARLSASGISVAALTRALAPVLTPSQLSQVAAVLRTPIPLHYYAFGSGLVAGEPTTGAIIELRNIIDGIAVAPGTSGMRTLIRVLGDHATVAGVPAALAELRRLVADPPQPVYELRYTQTPASIASMVRTTRSQLNQISLAEHTLPLAMAVLGVVLLVVGVVLWRRRRPPERGVPTLAVPEAASPGAGAAERERHVA